MTGSLAAVTKDNNELILDTVKNGIYSILF